MMQIDQSIVNSNGVDGQIVLYVRLIKNQELHLRERLLQIRNQEKEDQPVLPNERNQDHAIKDVMNWKKGRRIINLYIKSFSLSQQYFSLLASVFASSATSKSKGQVKLEIPNNLQNKTWKNNDSKEMNQVQKNRFQLLMRRI